MGRPSYAAPAMSLLASGNPDHVLQSLSNDLMSPYCPGRTIAACPSPQARQLEDHILAEAKSGKSRDEIESALVARFGEEIVGYAPQPVLLVGGALVGLLALVLLFVMGRRWARRAEPAMAAAGDSAPTQAELDRLEDALDEEDGF